MNPAELVSQKRQTAGYIKADPTPIILVRNERVRTASGGWADSETTLASQTFKFLPASLAQQYTTPAVGGRAIVASDQLMGRWDADVEVGDTFSLDDENFEVGEVSKLDYRVMAVLIRRSAHG